MKDEHLGKCPAAGTRFAADHAVRGGVRAAFAADADLRAAEERALGGDGNRLLGAAALLTLLFDTGRLSGVPCRLLWAVNVLSAAGTAEEILTVRGRRSSVTKASIREAMDDLPLAGVISPAEET